MAKNGNPSIRLHMDSTLFLNAANESATFVWRVFITGGYGFEENLSWFSFVRNVA